MTQHSFFASGKNFLLVLACRLVGQCLTIPGGSMRAARWHCETFRTRRFFACGQCRCQHRLFCDMGPLTIRLKIAPILGPLNHWKFLASTRAQLALVGYIFIRLESRMCRPRPICVQCMPRKVHSKVLFSADPSYWFADFGYDGALQVRVVKFGGSLACLTSTREEKKESIFTSNVTKIKILKAWCDVITVLGAVAKSSTWCFLLCCPLQIN